MCHYLSCCVTFVLLECFPVVFWRVFIGSIRASRLWSRCGPHFGAQKTSGWLPPPALPSAHSSLSIRLPPASSIMRVSVLVALAALAVVLCFVAVEAKSLTENDYQNFVRHTRTHSAAAASSNSRRAGERTEAQRSSMRRRMHATPLQLVRVQSIARSP